MAGFLTIAFCLKITLTLRTIGNGWVFFSVFPLNNDFAYFLGFDYATFEQLVNNSLVLLLMLVRQSVRVRVQLDNDVFFTRRWIDPQSNGHFSHRSFPLCQLPLP